MFVDILPIPESNDNSAKVLMLTLLGYRFLTFRVREGLKEISDFISIGTGQITISETEDKD